MNMLDKILVVINTVLENRSQNKLESIDLNMSLRNDLGFDSLDLAEFTVRIESIFDIDVFEDGIVDTIGEIVNKLNK